MTSFGADGHHTGREGRRDDARVGEPEGRRERAKEMCERFGRFALVELAAGALHLAGGPMNDDVSAADFAALLKKRRVASRRG